MAVSEAEAKALWADFDAASRKVKSGMGVKQGGAGAENNYSAAYAALAKAGLVQPLRGRYR